MDDNTQVSAARWAQQQNEQWTPPSPPTPLKPTTPMPSERDLRDVRNGIKCRLVGGPFDGKAIALKAAMELSPVRGYADPEILVELSGGGWTWARYAWESRQPDDVNIYKYNGIGRESGD